MWKWVLRIAVGLVVIVAIGIYVVVRMVGSSGSTTIEKWVASQLQTTANSYLNPRLSFDDLDYEYPGTVHLKGLKIVADDTANPGQTITVIGTEGATVVLGEIPSIGKPVIIEKITLDKPVVRLVSVSPDSTDFIGLTDMVKTTDASTQPTDTGAPSPKLSEVFAMRLVELKGATVVYDPRIPGTQAMTLDDINTRLDVEPTNDGWYKLATKLIRSPVFELDVSGQLSLDTFDVRDLNLHIKAQLDRENDKFLPPQLQKILVEHEVRGALDLTLTGGVIVDRPLESTLAAKVRMSGANLAIDEYQIPIDDLSLSASVADGRAKISDLIIKALKGKMHITGDLPLSGEPLLNSTLTITDVVLEDTLRAGSTQGATPKYCGRLNADITLMDAPLMAIINHLVPAEPEATTQHQEGEIAAVPVEPPVAPPGTGEEAKKVEQALNTELTNYALAELPKYWGGGEVHVDQARLVVVPVLRELSAVMGMLKRTGGEPRERVKLIFEFVHDKIDLSEFDYRSDAAASHGRGTISLAQQLDLTIDAGGIFGRVGDALLAYRVTGPASDPKVFVKGGSEDLSRGTEKVGQSIGKGAGWLGRQIGKIGGKKKE